MEHIVENLCKLAVILTIIIFVGCGLMKQCEHEHELKLKCIEKTGVLNCDPPEDDREEVIKPKAVS